MMIHQEKNCCVCISNNFLKQVKLKQQESYGLTQGLRAQVTYLKETFTMEK